MARSPIKRLGRRKRGNSIIKILSKLEKALLPSPVSTHLASPKDHYIISYSKPKKDVLSED